ncbi:hypothetical protein [Halococcus salifodinae]|uniref:hypothetical protein n=1 Tax=Halococcus salifodinae TaxID=36738 RepID=UPI001375A365|nr:hypothetical protein [Halococcus salifodinae]
MHCAICGARFEGDIDHVRVEAEHIRTSDPNGVREYAFHAECWDRLSEGWMDPA